jgi:hypothetical protein
LTVIAKQFRELRKVCVQSEQSAVN